MIKTEGGGKKPKPCVCNRPSSGWLQQKLKKGEENHQSAAVESGEELSISSVRAIYLAGKLCGLSWPEKYFV